MENLTAVNRVFLKRTRRGHVKTHVRQTYLRDDLPTGSPILDSPELEPRLSSSARQYLMLDTNVVLHQIDLLERPALRDVIVLQTVLDEVRHNKISVHKRLRAIISDEQRRFHVFSNEFHRETYTTRTSGESPNDRNDRAIRVAAAWYQAQLGDQVELLLLTNDADNRRLAREKGLRAERVQDYVRGRPDASELLDLLSRSADEAHSQGAVGGAGGGAAGSSGGSACAGRAGGAKAAVRYAAHLPLSELKRGLESGELHQGKLTVGRHNSSEGVVQTQTLSGHSSILVCDREAMNRAIDGDSVVVSAAP
jgi:exosome complex exonuclease DIS3/RRP44